ncbi:hypothetical protein ACFC5X_15465 [Streptomyces sp. NPDC055952]|uniref:hypothetical protein n=1 Tax=Streptomyces sp. NPDC055952 TaxID=3345663 RepID=UPI0035D6D6E9
MIDTIASKYRFGTPWMDLPAHNPPLETSKTFFIFMTRLANRRGLSQLTARPARRHNPQDWMRPVGSHPLLMRGVVH